MPILGKDSYVIFNHEDINSGEDYGFILKKDKEHGPAVVVQREIDSDGDISIKVFFDVILADDLIDPAGSPHVFGREDDYLMLTSYLTQTTGVTITTPAGVYSNIGSSGHNATEFHYPNLSIVSVQLNNSGTYYPPVPQEDYVASVWDGTLTWATSYWR